MKSAHPPRLLTALLLAASPTIAAAQDIAWQAYLDLRLVAPTATPGWLDGGLGKTRQGDGSDVVQPSGAVAASWQLTPELLAVATLQLHPDTDPVAGLLDAYLRYRPVSTSRWRWSVRAGAFFPPVSLENDGIGWTSRWTLTPSAINSWVGEELRTVGAEARLEHRGERGTLDLGLALLRDNDPAGELLASRGWALGDLTTPLGGVLRQPDAYAPVARGVAPLHFEPFAETDGRPGWHADVSWESRAGNRLTLARYDSRADPESFERYGGRKVFSWLTRFWAGGAQVHVGEVVLLAQAMHGSTAFEPRPGMYRDTRFDAGYLLAGWNAGEWRPALRVDLFRQRQEGPGLAEPLNEHGHALTAALNWRPSDKLRITGEVLRVESVRAQRRLEGLAPRQVEILAQLSLRLLF